MYLQPKINKALDSAFLDLTVGELSFTLSNLANIVESALQPFGISVIQKHDPETSTYLYYVSGNFSSDDFFRGGSGITIFFSYDYRDSVSFYFNKEDYRELKFLVSSAVQHEFIHQWQQIRSDIDVNTPLKDEDYFSDKWEIDAYAHCVLLDITRDNCYNDIRNYSRLESKTLDLYRQYFAPDHWVMKRLMKKVYQYSLTCKWEE